MRPLVPALVALAALASCGAPAGPTACSIDDHGDGTRTITCPDGSSITVASGGPGVRCTVALEADGSRTISCSDGTVVRLDAGGRPIFPGGGGLAGVALLFGAADHAGTRVLVAGTGQQAVTDSTGAWLLGDLPAGFHDLRFEHEGFAPVTLSDVAALGEVREVPEVVLRRGLQLFEAQEGGNVVVSPAGDAALFSGSAAGVALWEQATRSFTVLVEGQGSGSFSEDGRSVAVLVNDPFFSGRELLLVDRATGSVAVVARGVDRWQWGAGGAVLAAVEYGESELQLVVFDVARAARHVVSRPANPDSFQLSDDGAFALTLQADGGLMLHEVATGHGELLVEGLPIWNGLRPSQLLPHGGGVLVVADPEQDGVSSARLVELPGRTSLLLMSRVDPWAVNVAADGRAATLIHPDTGGPWLWDARRGEVSEVGGGRWLRRSSFSPDGKRLLLLPEPAGEWSIAGPLEVAELEQGPGFRVCPVAAAQGEAVFLGDGAAIHFRDERGSNRLWELRSGEVLDLGGDPSTSPITGPDPDLIALSLQAQGGGHEVSLYSRSARTARLLASQRVGPELFFDPRGGALYSHHRRVTPAPQTMELVRIALPGGEVETLATGAYPEVLFPRTGASVLGFGCSGQGCPDGQALSHISGEGEVVLLADHLQAAAAGDGFVAYTVSGSGDASRTGGGFIAQLPEP